MTPRLPPLNAVRAFEAVARHGSFKLAADELCVTPAAVSHQIKSLEDYLGAPLFRRTSRQAELTEAGQRCYPSVHEAFERLRAGLALAHRAQEERHLVITAGPAFTSKWLAPRLHRFAEAYPDAETRISASLDFADFASGAVDVAVRFGDPKRIEAMDRTRLHAERLIEESVLPMCSPALLEGEPPLSTPACLAEHHLIHDDSLRLIDPAVPDWSRWFEVAKVGSRRPQRGTRYNHADHALQAAIDGAGVVLGRRVLATPDLVHRRLVAPFGLELRSGLWFFFVCPLEKLDRPDVDAFRRWIRSELRQDILADPGSPAHA